MTAQQPSPDAPTEDPRSDAELKAVLSRRTSEWAAFSAAFRLAQQTAAVGLPASLLFGVFSGLFIHGVISWVVGMKEYEPASVALLSQVGLGATAFCALYAAIQISKSGQPSLTRQSWWPALLAVPFAGITGAVWMQRDGGANGQMGLMALSLALIGAMIVWQTFAGAAANIAWMRSAKNAMEGRSTDLGEVVGEVQRRTLEVAAVHGAKATAITVGNQFLLPGIFYSLQLAFAEAIVVLDPSRPALKRAGQLSSGIRGRLFRMLVAWWLVTFAVTSVITMGLDGARTQEEFVAAFWTMMIDPSSMSRRTFVLQETLWALSAWILQLAWFVLYAEREEMVKARAEVRRRQKAAPAASA